MAAKKRTTKRRTRVDKGTGRLASGELQPLTVNFPAAILERLDALTAERQANEAIRRVTRTEVMMSLLDEGLKGEGY